MLINKKLSVFFSCMIVFIYSVCYFVVLKNPLVKNNVAVADNTYYIMSLGFIMLSLLIVTVFAFTTYFKYKHNLCKIATRQKKFDISK